jgi:predicted nucleic acid-binding Zn ribbon protein
MFEENFQTCTICKRLITSDADIPVMLARYCKLCGMLTEGMDKFCCEKCGAMFKRFVSQKKEVKKWKKRS